MDTKTILITALFALSVLLFAGLPEDGANAAAASGQIPDPSDHTHSGQTPDPSTELAGLRQERVRLYRELNLLRTRLANQSAMIRRADIQAGSCFDREEVQEPAGVTVYLETSSGDAHDNGVQWTAVNVRDAGISPDGSKQAVLSISSMASQGREPALGHRNRRDDWQ
jgi:hypothetical protein